MSTGETSASFEALALGERIRVMMREIGTQVRAAKVAEVEPRTLHDYVRARTKPPFEVVARLAAAGGFDLNWAATGQGEMRLPTVTLEEARERNATDLERSVDNLRRHVDASSALGSDRTAVLVTDLRAALSALAGQRVAPAELASAVKYVLDRAQRGDMLAGHFSPMTKAWEKLVAAEAQWLGVELEAHREQRNEEL